MKKLKTFEIINLVDYTISKIVPKQYQELEKAMILARLKEVSKRTKRNLTREQVLEISYKQLGVDTIWKNILQFMK